jgi:putative tricarboxylic transport membrane protein
MISKCFNLERITAGILLILGVAVVLDSRKLDYWTAFGPGAGFFPFWLGVALIVASLYLLVKGVEGPVLNLTPEMKKLILFVGSLLACIVVLPYLGWVISFSAFVGVLLRLISDVSRVAALKVTLSVLVFIQLIFAMLLQIPLPKGLLPF